MSQYGNAGLDRREGNSGRRAYDPPAACGSRTWYAERLETASRLMKGNATDKALGRSIMRSLRKSGKS